MGQCTLFLMEDSSSSDDSDLEELLDDDVEQTAVILAAKEILDVRPKKRKRSTMGRLCISQNHALGYNLLMRDYFAEVPTYPPHLFRRRYRMRRSLFNKIVDACEINKRYFKRKRNAAGLIGFSAHQKIYVVMHIIACGIPVDYADEYLHIGEDRTMESICRFCKVMIRVYGPSYLRAPNVEDTVRLMAENGRRGSPDMASPINFNQFLEKEKLKSNGSNFTDWFRHVRIFLNGGNLQYVLDAPLGDPPAETETDEVKNVYATRKTRYSQVQCAILCSLEADLQKRFEHHDPHELINELKTIFETHAAVECYEASKHFFSCMMEEGSSVSEHMLAMTGHAKKLSDLGIVIPNRLGINRVLQSLPPSYKNFVMNYNMQNMNKELPELFAMLKSAEIEIKKEHQVLMVNKTTSFKKQGKSKGKNKKSGKKAATPPVKPKAGPKPDAECYYCKEKGHWKHNCSKYLADLKSGLVKKKKEGISDIHVIDVYLTGSRTRTKE
ncbi:hypothetical protein QYE76_052658 [Lolium multiflorum]|uniref:CCHC-type domain-containing protein n=1 Tax=Lolium multiflorum TaxID=4521 RepID=A0AAD8SVF6_LOLMU|nr:hypothetical protein QYE76_052658 [Lolium multiflorum]